MSKYLLLRDNKQTGPLTYEEILEIGFRKYDLVWVEGKSAAWRYPGEIAEFKDHAPLLEEQPFDRFFRKPVWEESREQEAESREQEAESREQVAEKRDQVAESREQEKGNSKYLPKEHNTLITPAPAQHRPAGKKYVTVTLPTNKQTVINKPIVEKLAPIADPPKVQSNMHSSQPEIESSGMAKGSLRKESKSAFLSSVSNDSDNNELVNSSAYPSGATSTGSPLLQYISVAAAVLSLLVIGVLIGRSMEDQPSLPPAVISEPSRITELKERLREREEQQQEQEQINRYAVVNDPVEPVKTSSPAPVAATRTSKKKTPAVREENLPATPVPAPENEGGKRVSVRRTAAANPESTENGAWKKDVSVELTNYKISPFGGIDNIEVTVSNGSNKNISKVTVELRYILSNQKQQPLIEYVVFNDIEPGANHTVQGPKSKRGIRLEARITSISE